MAHPAARQAAEHEDSAEPRFPSEPQENLLYFIEKNAPLLEPWQREIVRIVRKIAQYFYPQRQTQVMNEGWATFWHYTLLNHLYDEGMLTDGFMMEFLQSPHQRGLPAALQQPLLQRHQPLCAGLRDVAATSAASASSPPTRTATGSRKSPAATGVKSLDFAMRNFKDESFIAQYLSPKLIRDFKLFAVLDDDREDKLEVTAIHDDAGYRTVRQPLADQYNLGNREPNIQVYEVDVRGDRSLTLRHYMHDRRPLGESTPEMLRHVARLWGFTVRIESVDQDGESRLVAASEG